MGKSLINLGQTTTKHICSVCRKHFKKPCLLERHSVVHNDTKPFECDVCSKRFSQKSSLQRHAKHSHEGEKKHNCSKCQASFAQRTNLLQHISSTHPTRAPKRNQTTFDCTMCPCIFSKLNSLRRHIRVRHATEIMSTFEGSPQEGSADDYISLAQNVMEQLKSLQGCDTVSEEEDDLLEKAALSLSMNTHFIDSNSNVNSLEASSGVQCLEKFICGSCSKTFRLYWQLREHSLRHSSQMPHKCNTCGKSHSTLDHLRAHEKIHKYQRKMNMRLGGGKMYACDNCSRNFDSQLQLRKHLANVKRPFSNKEYRCRDCDEVFASIQLYATHSHFEGSKEKPSVVDLSRTEQRDLRRHLKLEAKDPLYHHSTIGKKEYQCAYCKRPFDSDFALKVHHRMRTNHKRYACTLCHNVAYKNPWRWRFHMILRHGDAHLISQFICSLCDQRFSSIENCRMHMRIHLRPCTETIQDEDDSNADITVSQSQFIELQMLPNCRRHQHRNVVIVETVKKPPSSQQSPAVSIAAEDHLPAKNICEICAKPFQKPSDLHRHLRTHTRERPFNCDQCRKSFALKSTLDEHQRTHLPVLDRQRIECQVCGKSYASRKVLALHLRLHTGEFPFRCDQCDRRFRTSGHRLAHMRSFAHTGIG